MNDVEKLAFLYIKDINEKYELELLRLKIPIDKLKEWRDGNNFNECLNIISDHYWDLFNGIK
jgi:hypothetical protein